jgi:hypothetical protein
VTSSGEASSDHISVETVRGVRDQLERLLDAVRSGQLTAPSGMVTRLEGAITALDALLGVVDYPLE